MTEMATHINPATGHMPYQSAQLNWTYDTRMRISGETDAYAVSGIGPQPATGEIRFLGGDSGSGSTICNRLLGCIARNPDAGDLTVSLTGPTYTFVADVPYDGEYDNVLAAELADALNSPDDNGNPPLVNATQAGPTVNMTTLATGTAADYPMAVTVTDPDDYPNQVSGAGLTGGSNGSSGGTLYSYGLTYQPNSNVQSVNDTVIGDWTYSYDNLNRLQTAVAAPDPLKGYAPYQSAQLGWVYDSFGNYVNEALSGSTSFSMPQPSPYSYTSANQIVGFNYDSAGNQTSDPVLGPNTYVYDAENRVYSSGNGSTTYLYDAEGRRVAKLTGGVLTNQYLLGLGGEQVTELDGNGSWLHSNAYAAGKLLATYDNVGLHFQFSDWLGSRRVQADGLGNVEETCLNLPFGDMLNCSGSGSDATEQHFTGKFHDNESGLDYFGARYLNSGVGRFMSPDWYPGPAPIPYANIFDPQTLNLYIYAGNNPLSRFDLDGHNWFTDFAQGLADSTYRPIVHIVEHPIATAEGIGTAIAHPIVTGEAIGSAVKSTVIAAAHGDGRAIGQIVGTVGTAIAGGAIARGVGVAGEIGAEAGEFVGPTTSVTTEESVFYHYGFAADESKFANGLREGSYATNTGDLTGAGAKSSLSLPHPNAPDSVYKVTPGVGTPVNGPSTVAPQFGQPGGGQEFTFPQGTGPGTVGPATPIPPQ